MKPTSSFSLLCPLISGNSGPLELPVLSEWWKSGGGCHDDEDDETGVLEGGWSEMVDLHIQ